MCMRSATSPLCKTMAEHDVLLAHHPAILVFYRFLLVWLFKFIFLFKGRLNPLLNNESVGVTKNGNSSFKNGLNYLNYQSNEKRNIDRISSK